MIDTIIGCKKKHLLSLAVFSVLFLLLSSMTLVPQVEGSTVNEALDDIREQHQLATLINEMTTNHQSSEEMRISMEKLIALLPEYLGSINLSDNDEIINPTSLSPEYSEFLSSVFDSYDKEIPQQQGIFLNLLKHIINRLLSRLFDTNAPTTFGLIDFISLIIALITQLTTMVVQGTVQVVNFLFSIIFRIIRSIIGIIFLLGSSIQLALLIFGLFFTFIGVVSKIGIKVLSFISAPIFALIAIMLALFTGQIIGGIALIINLVIALAIVFAFPLIIMSIILFLISGSDINFSFDGISLFREGGLLYMIISILSSIINPQTY